MLLGRLRSDRVMFRDLAAPFQSQRNTRNCLSCTAR